MFKKLKRGVKSLDQFPYNPEQALMFNTEQ